MEVIKWFSVLGLLPFFYCLATLIFFYFVMPILNIRDNGIYMGYHIGMFVAGGISIILFIAYVTSYLFFGMDVVYIVSSVFGIIMIIPFLYCRYIEK